MIVHVLRSDLPFDVASGRLEKRLQCFMEDDTLLTGPQVLDPSLLNEARQIFRIVAATERVASRNVFEDLDEVVAWLKHPDLRDSPGQRSLISEFCAASHKRPVSHLPMTIQCDDLTN